MVAASECLFECRSNVNGDVDADLIDQTQRPHRHTPFQQCIVDLLCVDAGFEKLSRIEQIWEQDAIDEKSGTVSHNDRKLSNLPNERECAFLRVVRGFLGNNHFDKFHSADWIKKMQTNYPFRRNRHRGQFADPQRRSVSRHNRFRPDLHREVAKDLLLDFDLFRRGFDDESDITQFHRRRRGHDSRASLLGLFFGYQTALDRLGIGLFDVRKPPIDLIPAHVTQNHSHAM